MVYGANLSESDIIDRLCGSGLNVRMTSFDTAENMEKFLEKRVNIITLDDGTQYMVQGVDITNYYKPFENCIISRFEKDGDKITR